MILPDRTVLPATASRLPTRPDTGKVLMYHPFEASYIAKRYTDNQWWNGDTRARDLKAVHHLSGERQETSDSRFPLILPALSRIKMWPCFTPGRSSTSITRDLTHLPIFSILRPGLYIYVS